MEFFITIAIIYGFFWLGGFIIEKIGEWNDERKRSIRDGIAHDLLSDEFIHGLKGYEKKFEKIKYLEESKLKYFTKDETRLVQSHFNYMFNSCPECGNGNLVERKGRFGKFYGCSNYPSCTYTKNFKDLINENKEISKEEFLNDLKEAYKL